MPVSIAVACCAVWLSYACKAVLLQDLKSKVWPTLSGTLLPPNLSTKAVVDDLT